MVRHRNDRTRRYPYGHNLHRNYGVSDHESERMPSNEFPYDEDSGPRRGRKQDAWQRVDEQKGDHHFSRRDDRDYDYSGYYGDANAREHLGTNRFGSGQANKYQDNRNLDHDDNFINQQVGSGYERNIGTREGWDSESSNTRGRISTYGMNSGAGFNRRLRGDRPDEKGPFFGKGPRNWKRSDERIKEEACEALYQSHEVDASEIDLTVKDAVVTLSGSVESRRMKREAEECIENLTGVLDVQNQLRIKNNERSAEITGNALGKDPGGHLS